MKHIASNEYGKFLNEIKLRIASARLQAVRSVNRELIKLYWDIGKNIVERQEKYKWGDNVVEALARDLKDAFPQTQGFSERNLWNMRRLYGEYKNQPILQQLVAEIPWGHNLLVMEKVAKDNERKYYLTASRDFGWSRNVLLNQIKADSYTLSLKQKTHNFPQVLPAHLSEQADEATLKSISVKSGWGGARKLPRVFTEQGVAMLSAVLRSKRAILMNIAIMREGIKRSDTSMMGPDCSRRIFGEASE